MTVSNLGMYNIPSFSAIINPPQGGGCSEGWRRSRAFWLWAAWRRPWCLTRVGQARAREA